MGDRGCLENAVGRIRFFEKTVPSLTQFGGVGFPKLAHRNIRHRTEIEIAGGIHVVGFDGKLEAVLVGIRFHDLGVVLEDQILRSQAHIPKETLALLQALHRPARIGQKERLGIIAASFFELVEKRSCPVLRARLPAVHVEIGQSVFLRARPDFFQ